MAYSTPGTSQCNLVGKVPKLAHYECRTFTISVSQYLGGKVVQKREVELRNVATKICSDFTTMPGTKGHLPSANCMLQPESPSAA